MSRGSADPNRCSSTTSSKQVPNSSHFLRHTWQTRPILGRGKLFLDLAQASEDDIFALIDSQSVPHCSPIDRRAPPVHSASVAHIEAFNKNPAIPLVKVYTQHTGWITDNWDTSYGSAERSLRIFSRASAEPRTRNMNERGSGRDTKRF